MKGKFKIMACKSCRHKACARFIFHGLKSPSLSPANYLNETNCIFFKKVPRLNQFQNFRFSSNDLRIALRHFARSGIWNPAHISSPQKLREQCYRLIRQGRLSILSRPYHTNELKEFRDWATKEPHRVRFLMGSLPMVRKVELKPEEAAPAAAREIAWIKFKVVLDKSGDPIEGIKLKIRLPDGSEIERPTRADGMIEINGIQAGTCDATCEIKEAKLSDAYHFVGLGGIAGSSEGGIKAQEMARKGSTGLSSSRKKTTPVIVNIQEHKVKTGETLDSLARLNGLTWKELAIFNWGTSEPKEINEFLRDEVGCTKKTSYGKNYVFDDNDSPGIILIPQKWSISDLRTEQTHYVRAVDLSEKGDWIEILVTNGIDDPFDGEPYVLYLSNGQKIKGELDLRGRLRKRNVPIGDYQAEFPGLFTLVRIENGKEVEGHSRGNPLPLPPKPSVQVSREGIVENDLGEIMDKVSDEVDDDDTEIDLNDLDPELAALLVEDETDSEGDALLTLEKEHARLSKASHENEESDFPEFFEKEEEGDGAFHDEYEITLFTGKTGQSYHLAAMHCISIRLRREDGQWHRDPLDYAIQDTSGKNIFQGTSREGIIFYDGVGMGDYRLVIKDRTYYITSTPHAAICEHVFLTSKAGGHKA